MVAYFKKKVKQHKEAKQKEEYTFKHKTDINQKFKLQQIFYTISRKHI